MSGNGKRDPNLDCQAVKLYREVVHLQANYLQREAIAETVQCNERGLRLWTAVLVERMLNGDNPKAIPSMLRQWELEYYG